MKIAFILVSLLLSSLAYSVEVKDIVMNMKKNQGDYEVSFGSVARIYNVAISDKSVECLQYSLAKKEKVNLKLDPSSGRITTCSI